MFGLISKLAAKEGQRDVLITLIMQGADVMPGCISYVVAMDADNANEIWITEVWDSAESHAASLQLPSVAASIQQAMPLIDMTAESLQKKTTPVGGRGVG
ncbi:putative quinol monooxygenase [Brevundimonas diminuta]|uniref:Antibiotic biosynthesis monooxygenase n=1 Tax=Brevundimonas diminuta TaxID=293 RepID=A0A1Z3LVN0_BREDI|nr:antibiotic biosynthesis monooxygenase [Brevundimonas diminuta]ASD26231.1 antibiotic biosynthesis monooxygenase [Brevundimonas diminuta]